MRPSSTVVRRTVATLAALALAALVGAPPARAPAGQVASTTVLLRDNEAGRWRWGATAEGVQPDTIVEPSIAVDPADPLHAVAGYQEGRVDQSGAATNGYAVTFDGGRTWTFGDVPKLTAFDGGTYQRSSDPVVAFGAGGVVYFSSLVLSDLGGGELITAVMNSTSRDGGRTWDPPVVVHADETGYDDKNWIVADLGDGPGHHKGRLYVVWYRIVPLVSYSDDEGRTWAPFTALDAGQGVGATPMVMPNGDLAVVYTTYVGPQPPVHDDPGDNLEEPVAGLTKLRVAVARGAGLVPTGTPLVFAPATTVGTYQGTEIRKQRAFGGIGTAAVDPRTGRLYAGWPDARYRTDRLNDVVITASDDGGLTWSAPQRINGGPVDDWVNHWNIALTVGDDGLVRAAYRTRQEAADVDAMSPYVDTYYQESTDGTTWTAPLRVNTVRTHVRFAAFSRGGAFLGDYQQVATSGPLTYVVRAEAYSVDPTDIAAFPPAVHHQRAWVAVLGAPGAADLGATGSAAAPTVAPAPAPATKLPGTL